MRKAWTTFSSIAFAAVAAATLAPVASATVIFQDTFDRMDNRNIDASLDGVTNNTGTPLPADGVYTHAFIDPNNADPTSGVQDGDPVNGGGAAIVGDRLHLAIGAGTSSAFVNHNFINPSILASGQFTVSLDVDAPGDFDQGGAFAIGMTDAEAAAGNDAFNDSVNNPNDDPAYSWAWTGTTGGQNGKTAGTVLSDFWVALRGNSTVIWGGPSGSTVSVVGGLARTGTISATFYLTDFNAGSDVDVDIFFNGGLIGSDSFQWTDTNANYIALDARDGGAVPVDNFIVSTIPEPAAVCLGLFGAFALLARPGRVA